MKKLLFTLFLCVSALSSSAQLKTIDLRANVRGDFGIGAGVTMGVLQYIDFAPSFNYFFTDGGSTWSADADFHYNIELDDEWELYPLAGGCLVHGRNENHDTRNKLGIDLGCGVHYYLTDQVDLFGEIKYPFLIHEDGMSKTYLTIGVSLNLD